MASSMDWLMRSTPNKLNTTDLLPNRPLTVTKRKNSVLEKSQTQNSHVTVPTTNSEIVPQPKRRVNASSDLTVMNRTVLKTNSPTSTPLVNRKPHSMKSVVVITSVSMKPLMSVSISSKVSSTTKSQHSSKS